MLILLFLDRANRLILHTATIKRRQVWCLSHKLRNLLLNRLNSTLIDFNRPSSPLVLSRHNIPLLLLLNILGQLRPSLIVRDSIVLNTLILCIVFDIYIHLTVLIPRDDFLNILLLSLRPRLGLYLVALSLRGLHALQRFPENSSRLILDRW